MLGVELGMSSCPPFPARSTPLPTGSTVRVVGAEEHMETLFQSNQKKKCLDVYWLFDDGGNA